jgi:hypothetical protein
VSLTVGEDPPTVRIVRIDLPERSEDHPMEDADVWAEAAQPRTASFDRWRIGTVTGVRGRSPVSQHTLRNFGDSADALFSIKIVATDGRILASSDDIRPDDRRAGERESLLQVRSRPLGELTWTLDFAPDGQTFLIVNSRIPAAETWIESDPIASALVLPAALRTILARLLADEAFRDNEWGRAWAEWAATMSPAELPSPDDPDDHHVWIEQTVGAFAEHHRLASRTVAAMESKDQDA